VVFGSNQVFDGILLIDEIESVDEDTLSVNDPGLSVALYVGLQEASAAIATMVSKVPGFIKRDFFKNLKIIDGDGHLIICYNYASSEMRLILFCTVLQAVYQGYGCLSKGESLPIRTFKIIFKVIIPVFGQVAK